MVCLPHRCCWTVLPDGVIKHNFFQKCYNLACLCAWGSEGSSPAGHKWIFPVLLGEPKWWKLCFATRTKKTAFIAEIFEFLSLFRHPCLYIGKSSCHTVKIGVTFKRLSNILKLVTFCWLSYIKSNIWQISFDSVFALAILNTYNLFLHWQHNWHPCRPLASCYIWFDLSLHFGI